MAESKRSIPLDCELVRLERRRRLEETPMCRVSPPEAETMCCAPLCGAELADLLETQIALLWDILGAVNALAASQLAARDQER